MAKRCNSCGFQWNPDSAHYCGKCGKQLGYGDNYKLYNASLQTPVYNSTLNNYKKYEKQVNTSWLFNTSDKIKGWWSQSDKDDLKFWLFMAALVFITLGCIFFFPKSCSSDNKISRIEVNGKYGIGYNEDNMLVPATYDSISQYNEGHQWVLFDRSTSEHGIAFVTDSITNVIEPQKLKAKGVRRLANGATMARIDDKNIYADGKYLMVSRGCLNNTNEYKRYKIPSNGEETCIVATLSDGGMQMLSAVDGMPINGKTYFNIVIDQDSMIRAIHYAELNTKYKTYNTTTIHDYSGSQVSDKEFYGVNAFSDGVAWAYLTAQDRKNNSHSLIDKKGNVLFTKPNSVNGIEFRDGIGWYAPTYSSNTTYTAVDKTGKDLFRIQAQKVYPFTMGLAPVYKGTSYSNEKLGFVDKTGKEVIPFKYKSKYSNPHFGLDSIMDGISLNGVEGKLHRNGTFIPNK